MNTGRIYRRRPQEVVGPKISRVAARKSNGQSYNNIMKASLTGVALLAGGIVVWGASRLYSPKGDVAPNNNLNTGQSQNAENPYNNGRYNQIETPEGIYKIVTPQASSSPLPQTPSDTKTLESRLETSPGTPATKSTAIDQTAEQGTVKPQPYVGGGSDADSENIKRDILAKTQPATPPPIDSGAKNSPSGLDKKVDGIASLPTTVTSIQSGTEKSPAKDYTPPTQNSQPKVIATPNPAENKAPSVVPAATLADLVFGNVSYTAGGWDRGYISGKQDHRVQIVVSNNGNAPSGTFYISAKDLEQRLRLDGVPPGKTLSAGFDLKLPAGKNSIDILIEPDDSTKEKGNNNSYTLSITVPEPPFKFVWDGSMPEKFNTYRENALEDYRKVLRIYGIKEEDARMVVSIGKQGYGVGFYHDGKEGVGVGGLSDLWNPEYRNRGAKHEMSHAINHTLFPTKNEDEAWYDTLDEGSSMKAGGEIEEAKQTSTLLREDNGSLKNYNWMAAIELLVSNPNKFWKEVVPPENPGWLTGQVLYLLLEREGLTLEMHTKALKILADLYKEPNLLTNKGMIQTAYERAMGKNLSYTFKLLEPGIDRFYGTGKSSGLLPGQIYATFQREETGKDGKPITVTYKITNPAA